MFRSTTPTATFSFSPLKGVEFEEATAVGAATARFSTGALHDDSKGVQGVYNIYIGPDPVRESETTVLVFLYRCPRQLVVYAPSAAVRPGVVDMRPPEATSNDSTGVAPDTKVDPTEAVVATPLTVTFLFAAYIVTVDPAF